MSGKGRKRVRNASNTQGSGNGEDPNVMEIMRLMTEAMTNKTGTITSLIQNHNGNHNPPTLPSGNANDDNQQEKFIRLKPHTFEGSTDPLVVDKWREDTTNNFMAMRYTQLQRQHLYFCERLDARYFPATVRTKKIKEFVDGGQIRGDLVDDTLIGN
ncbi:hypothetical protein MKX01_010336 [Papaver californicum]|nr:hypothetical protein MKX01_010336 [Papaver californicum]